MIINVNTKIYTLVQQDENIIPLLVALGFKDITRPGMLQTVGKIMTLKKGAAFRNIDLAFVIKVLEEKGYKVIDE